MFGVIGLAVRDAGGIAAAMLEASPPAARAALPPPPAATPPPAAVEVSIEPVMINIRIEPVGGITCAGAGSAI